MSNQNQLNEFFPIPKQASFQSDIAILKEKYISFVVNRDNIHEFRVDLFRSASELIPWDEVSVIGEEEITISLGFFPERWFDPVLLWLNKNWTPLSAPAFIGKKVEKFTKVTVPIKWKKEIHREYVRADLVKYLVPQRIEVEVLSKIPYRSV